MIALDFVQLIGKSVTITKSEPKKRTVLESGTVSEVWDTEFGVALQLEDRVVELRIRSREGGFDFKELYKYRICVSAITED